MSEEHPARHGDIESVAKMLQEFAVECAGHPVIVDTAVVVWEEVRLDEDGEAERRIQYTVPMDNWSMSGTLGLLEAAREFVRRDILGERGE